MKGGVHVSKARFLTLFVTMAPLALTLAKLAIHTGTGGLSDGGHFMV